MRLPLKRPSSTSPTATRVAFGVIIVFVLAQVVWWIVFQHNYITDVTRTTLQTWEKDVEAANAALERAPGDEALIDELERDYPHLQLVGGRFVLDAQRVAAFRERQEGFVRMFAFEGPFFVLVVLSGLTIIARSLRAERELKRRQQNFLSAITHEFKTPLGTLRLLIETALYRALNPDKQRQYLEKMERELSRLEKTSEQVLASARLEGGKTSTHLQAADLNEAVRGTVESLRGGLEARGASLTVHYSPQPLPVSLDGAAFGIVLGNLLDNAVKYSPGSEKRVTVRLVSQHHLAVLHVEDEGVGVNEGETRRVFDKFYRVGNEMTRESTGVGLGLHLVKTMTEAMNGWVRCERLPQGTRFSVVLPRRLEARAVQPITEPA